MTEYFAGDPRTNRERMLAGDLYIDDDPDNDRIAHRALRLLETYRLGVLAGRKDAARAALAEVLGTLGEDAVVNPPLFVAYGENVQARLAELRTELGGHLHPGRRRRG